MYIRITYGNKVSIFMSVYFGKGLSVSLQDCMHAETLEGMMCPCTLHMNNIAKYKVVRVFSIPN